MTHYIVDRCYDRYIITMSCEGAEEGVEGKEQVELLQKLLLSVLDERLQTGCLKSCRILGDRTEETAEEGGLCIDVEAASGYEDYLAATIDTLTSGMCLLAEQYPETLEVES